MAANTGAPSAPGGEAADADAPRREPPAMSVRNAAAWAMGGQYIGFFIQFATSVIISRFFLSPEEVGLFSIAMAAALFVATIQDFGISRYISGLKVATHDEIKRCSTVALFFSLIIASTIAALSWPLAKLYGQPELTPLLLIIGSGYLFFSLSIVPMALMGRKMEFSHHFVVNVGSGAVSCGVSLALAAAGFSAFSLAWGTLAASIARGVIAQWLRPANPFPLRLDGLNKILSFGSKATTLYFTGALGSRSPDLIVGKFTSLTGVGLFSRATSLSEQLRMLIAGAVGSVLFPAFARIRDRGEPLGPAYIRVTAGYCATVWPGMVALTLASEPIVRILYGPAWLGVAPLLAYVSLASVIFNALPLVSDLPILMGKMNRLIAYNLFDTAISLALLVVGSIYWGVEGAAASRIVYAAIWFALYFGFMRGIVEFRMNDLLDAYLRSMAATVAAVLPLALTMTLWLGPDRLTLPALLLSAAVGGVLWLLTMRMVRHVTFDEISQFARSIPIVKRVPLFHA